jgi:hypothetical protein
MGRPQESETRNTYTIHQHPEAKRTTESLIKITGSISRNTEHTVANTTQGKLLKTCKRGTKTKRQRRESLLTANILLYLNFNQDILIL